MGRPESITIVNEVPASGHSNSDALKLPVVNVQGRPAPAVQVRRSNDKVAETGHGSFTVSIRLRRQLVVRRIEVWCRDHLVP
jgi:hypothetical protein